MTVSDLIEELGRMPPSLPVKVLLSEVVVPYEDGELDTIYTEETDALPLDRVQHAGAYVLLQG